MTGIAILIFLGETLMGTLLFVAIAGLIKYMAEREETAEEQPAAVEQPTVNSAPARPAKFNL